MHKLTTVAHLAGVGRVCLAAFFDSLREVLTGYQAGDVQALGGHVGDSAAGNGDRACVIGTVQRNVVGLAAIVGVLLHIGVVSSFTLLIKIKGGEAI